MRPMVPLVVMLVAPALFAQEKSVEQGVYTGGQAARGTRLFESNCASCHREPGGNAPVLSGERFTKTFSDATLQTVFTPIKTTPRQAPGSALRRGVRRHRDAPAEDPGDDAAAQLDAAPLGARSFRLQQVYGAPGGWSDQKVVAKGFLTRSGNEERVNVTSMRTLSSSCAL